MIYPLVKRFKMFEVWFSRLTLIDLFGVQALFDGPERRQRRALHDSQVGRNAHFNILAGVGEQPEDIRVPLVSAGDPAERRDGADPQLGGVGRVLVARPEDVIAADGAGVAERAQRQEGQVGGLAPERVARGPQEALDPLQGVGHDGHLGAVHGLPGGRRDRFSGNARHVSANSVDERGHAEQSGFSGNSF